MEVPVFSNGAWIHYPVPPSTSWPSSYQLKAASAYAKALRLGYKTNQSATLAECVVNKLIYPGLEYNQKIESDLLRLVRE
jgi:hypothetical protein